MANFQQPFGSDETKKFLAQFFNERPMLKSFFGGALSGTCSTLLFQPFDLLKTRVQNAHFVLGRPNVAATSPRPTKFVPIMLDVIKNEQLIGLWRGTIPVIILLIIIFLKINSFVFSLHSVIVSMFSWCWYSFLLPGHNTKSFLSKS